MFHRVSCFCLPPSERFLSLTTVVWLILSHAYLRYKHQRLKVLITKVKLWNEFCLHQIYSDSSGGECRGGYYLSWSAALQLSSLSLTGDSSWTKRTPVIGNTLAPPSGASRDHMAACDWPVVRSRDLDLSCHWSKPSAVGASSVPVTTSEYSYSRNSSAGRIYHELVPSNI